MPSPAFIPGPLAQAEGRSFRNFYPRQVRGLVIGTAGGLLGAWFFGVGTPLHVALAFALALPGFAYGFFQPGGMPVEQWTRIRFRFLSRPRILINRKEVRCRRG